MSFVPACVFLNFMPFENIGYCLCLAFAK